VARTGGAREPKLYPPVDLPDVGLRRAGSNSRNDFARLLQGILVLEAGAALLMPGIAGAPTRHNMEMSHFSEIARVTGLYCDEQQSARTHRGPGMLDPTLGK
jgi:hypothetical protein